MKAARILTKGPSDAADLQLQWTDVNLVFRQWRYWTCRSSRPGRLDLHERQQPLIFCRCSSFCNLLLLVHLLLPFVDHRHSKFVYLVDSFPQLSFAANIESPQGSTNERVGVETRGGDLGGCVKGVSKLHSSQLSGRLHLLGSSRTVDGATKVPQGSPQQELPTTMESQKLRILVNAAAEVEQAAATPPIYRRNFL
jgi:hypothetical protein